MSTVKKQANKQNKSLLNSVTQAIISADAIPDPAKNMLSNMLGLATGTYKEERAPFQIEVIGMVQQVLDASEASLEQKCKAQDKICDELPAQEQQAESAVQECEAKLAAEQAVTMTAKRELAEAAQQYKSAAKTVDQCRTVQHAAEVDYESLLQKKEKLETAFTNIFERVLQEGGTKEAVDNVVVTLKKLQYEENSIMAARTALLKEVTDRSPFDAMVIKELQDATSRKLGSLDSAIQAEEPARRDRVEAMSSAEASADKAKQGQIRCAKRYTDSLAGEAVWERSLSSAKRHVVEFRKEASKQQRMREKLANELHFFQSGPKASFMDLVEYTAPSFPTEAASEVEPVPVALDF